MLFLTDVDHVSFEKANETRQNNLQSATVSLQVVIGLCKRKETAALKSKPPFHRCVKMCLLCDGFFLLPSRGRLFYNSVFYKFVLTVHIEKFNYNDFRAIVKTDGNNTVT